MKIFPTILQKNVDALVSQLHTLEHTFNYFQIDVADGTYVESSTASLRDMAEVASQGLIPRATYEFHLMVDDIPAHIHHLAELTSYIHISRVIIHLEPARAWAKKHHPQHELYHALTASFPYPFGIAIGPEDKFKEQLPDVLSMPLVQIMTVVPGAQGRPFIPESLDYIDYLHERGYQGEIQLDGGINDDTLPEIASRDIWPDAVCPGSYFASGDLVRKLEELEEIIARESS